MEHVLIAHRKDCPRLDGMANSSLVPTVIRAARASELPYEVRTAGGQAAQASAEQQMAESMAQGFVGGPGSQFPYSFMGATPEQVQAFHQALATTGVAPEMQHFLQHSVTQVRTVKLINT